MSLVRGRIVAASRTVYRDAIAPVAVSQKSCDATDGRYADAGQIVYAAVGQAIFQQLDHLPAVYERLQFRGRA